MSTTTRQYHQKEKTVNGEKLVLRKAYVKEGYVRKAYTRKDGTKVKSTKVESTKVPASWIKKRGLTHGKYGQIPIKNNRHLREFGYSFSKDSAQRHMALRRAVDTYGRNWAVKRLTAIANIQPNLPKYDNLVIKARRDVKYIQKIAPSKTALKKAKSSGLEIKNRNKVKK